MSDFKTNEYASLLSGEALEPAEANPMLGFRGASRYAHPAYAEGFALECRAMKRVREDMGLTNVLLMLPFVRRVAEARQVLDRMSELGLRRGVLKTTRRVLDVEARLGKTSCAAAETPDTAP